MRNVSQSKQTRLFLLKSITTFPGLSIQEMSMIFAIEEDTENENPDLNLTKLSSVKKTKFELCYVLPAGLLT